jgi:DNA repair protein RadC
VTNKERFYIKELRARYVKRRVSGPAFLGEEVERPAKVYEMFKWLKEEPREKLLCLHLSTKYEIVSYEVVSVGSVNRSLVEPAEVFKGALLANALVILLVHNHPSGALIPSPEDYSIAERISKVGKELGVELLDFIVIGNGFYSFADNGNLGTSDYYKHG